MCRDRGLGAGLEMDATSPILDAFVDGIDFEDASLELAASSDEGDSTLELQGDYRALLLRPKAMSWEFLQSCQKKCKGTPDVQTQNISGNTHSRDLSIQFDLPPGAYATMALREVSKLQPPPSRSGHIRFLE